MQSWIRDHFTAVVVVVTLSLIGAVGWLILPQYNIFVIQRRLQEIWIILLGILSVPYSLLIIYRLPVAAAFSIPIVAILYGIIAQIFVTTRWPVRFVILSMVIVNCVFGYFVLVVGLGDGLLDTSSRRVECENVSSDDEGVRIVSYIQFAPDYAFLNYFFLESHDNGKSWEQVGYAGYETGISSCSLRMSVGNTHFNYLTCEPLMNARPAIVHCQTSR